MLVKRRISRPGRLSDGVVAALANDIHSGVVKPGDRLPTEMQLAEMFGVSRTVIREAISRLKADNLVISRQGLGVFVTSAIDGPRTFRIGADNTELPRTLRDVFELRMGVEMEAAGLAALRRTRPDIKALERALKTMETTRHGPDIGVAADVEFHRRIAQASKNLQIPRFLGFLENFLTEAIRTARANSARFEGLTDLVQDEHRAIFEAIAAGNRERAQDAMRHHLESAQKRLGLDSTGTKPASRASG